MTAESNHRLGDLQLAIMQALWQHGAAGVAEVRHAIGDHLAYTTVATMLRKMEDRGLVRHHEEGRRFIYEAAVSAEAVSRSMSNRLVDRLFHGSLAQTVCHLLETREVDQGELAQLERFIREKRQGR